MKKKNESKDTLYKRIAGLKSANTKLSTRISLLHDHAVNQENRILDLESQLKEWQKQAVTEQENKTHLLRALVVLFLNTGIDIGFEKYENIPELACRLRADTSKHITQLEARVKELETPWINPPYDPNPNRYSRVQ